MEKRAGMPPAFSQEESFIPVRNLDDSLLYYPHILYYFCIYTNIYLMKKVCEN
jgi:hypothetical protein